MVFVKPLYDSSGVVRYRYFSTAPGLLSVGPQLPKGHPLMLFSYAQWMAWHAVAAHRTTTTTTIPAVDCNFP